MGGRGSGTGYRYSRGDGKPVADQNLLRVDVRFMHRKGWLRANFGFSLNWSRGDEPVGNIRVETGPGDPPAALWLVYRSQSGGVGEWTPMRERVPLEWTPCNYGGKRPWLRCPRCSRRVAVLWGGSRFLCRHCNRLAYASQNESAMDRACSQSQKLRKRLGDDDDLTCPSEDLLRPNGMHASTFDRLTERIALQDIRWGRAAIAKFGFDPLA